MMEAREAVEMMKVGEMSSVQIRESMVKVFFFLNRATSHLANLLLGNKCKKKTRSEKKEEKGEKKTPRMGRVGNESYQCVAVEKEGGL